MILNDPGLSYGLGRCTLLEIDGEVAGGIIGGPATVDGIGAHVPPYLEPLHELELLAPDSWLLFAIVLYPEFRGQGLAADLIAEAVRQARASGAPRITLVAENSPRLVQFYEAAGFRTVASRPWLPFAGRQGPSAWLLFERTL